MPAKRAAFEQTLTLRTAEIEAEIVSARSDLEAAPNGSARSEAKLRLDNGLQHLAAIQSTTTTMQSPQMQSKRQKSFSVAVSDVVGYEGV